MLDDEINDILEKKNGMTLKIKQNYDYQQKIE